MREAGLQLGASVSLEMGQAPVMGAEDACYLSSPAQLSFRHQEAAVRE